MSIEVMIVDDSALMRESLQHVLKPQPDIRVIGAAMDPILALQRMQLHWPDVILLDVEMPRMDGISFLRQIMATRPTPVVICSRLGEQGGDIALQALALGAVAVISLPAAGFAGIDPQNAALLLDSIRLAARTKVTTHPAASLKAASKLSADVMIPKSRSATAPLRRTDKIVVLGTSAGGTHALEAVLPQLGLDAPPIAIVQHMPAVFTLRFAERLNSLCAIEVREACNGDYLQPGLALIAPGGRHMLLQRCGEHYRVEVRDGPLVSRHRPSVDVLFRSAAIQAGANALGVIMTGMGDDGARGLREMREAGAQTYAQDEASCVVFGMPLEAIKLGAAEHILSLDDIPTTLMKWR